MGLDNFKTEGPRTYTEDKNTGPSIESEVIHLPKGMELDDGLKPDGVDVHEIVMREQTLMLKLPGGSPYFICGDCGEVATSPESIVKTDKLEHREMDWADEVFSHILEQVQSLTTSDWEDRCETELPDYTKDGSNSDDSEDESEDDSSSGSGLDSFMS